VPVRLLSLLPVDLPPSADTGAIRIAARRDRRGARRGAGGLPGGLHADVASPRATASKTPCPPRLAGEIVLVGSSRLAQPRRLFLGSTAAKMLTRSPCR
jgi:hypothetical protein